MTNIEFYKDEIRKIGIHKLAVDKETGEPCNCYDTCCSNCKFYTKTSTQFICVSDQLDWLLEEYEEPKVDWSKVAVNTPIYVSDNGERWIPRYFAKYEDGAVYAWVDGATSWSTDGTLSWDFAKLAEDKNHDER